MRNFVVEELEDLGWSASRIRAALVREGWLSAEKALDRLHSNPTCPNAMQIAAPTDQSQSWCVIPRSSLYC